MGIFPWKSRAILNSPKIDPLLTFTTKRLEQSYNFLLRKL